MKYWFILGEKERVIWISQLPIPYRSFLFNVFLS